MDVIVNGVAHSVPDSCTLAELLSRLEQQADVVATAVNAEFIAREQRQGCVLRAGDCITCFQAIVGG